MHPPAALAPSFCGINSISFRGGGPRLAKVPGRGVYPLAPAGPPHLSLEPRQHLRCRVSERGPSVVISFHARIFADGRGARTLIVQCNLNTNGR